MSKAKKVLLMCTTYVLVAAIAIGGTLAYLTSTDSDVNVMTVGNVKVELNEKQRTEDYSALEDFGQCKEAMPIVGDTSNKDPKYNLTTNENYVDKIVYATNTGKSDAYMRILVALPAWADDPLSASENNLHWNVPADETSAMIQEAITEQYGTKFDPDADQYNEFSIAEKGAVKIDGVDFKLYSFTFKNPISGGESTNIVMTGVYLDCRVDYDGDIDKYLDVKGNPIEGFDGIIDVPVYVQAVQAKGFDDADTALNTAFGTDTAAWFGDVKLPTVVSTTEELKFAIKNAKDGDVIYMTAGTYETALNLQGKSLTVRGAGVNKTFIVGPKDYTTENIPMQSWAGWGQDANVYALISANEDVTIKDLTVKADPTQISEVAEFRHQGDCAFVGIHVQSANAVIENVDIKGIKPINVTGNDHHNFGLYFTSAIGDSQKYTATYKNGTVSDVNRGGIYCWGNKYTLNFENVTVIGPGNIDNPNGTLTPAAGSDKYIYAFAPFYLESPAKYKNVVVRDSYRVSWGGANWSWWGDNNWATNTPAGVTCIDCGIAD